MNGYKKFTNGLYKVNMAIGKVELLFAAIIMAVLTAVMTWQVVTRYWLNIPAPWAEELCRYLFIWASFVGSAYGVLVYDHIEIDLMDSIINAKAKNPEKFLAYLKKVILVVILIFSCYFFNLYLNFVQQIASLTQYSAALKVNMVYPMASGVVGLGLIIFHTISLLLMPIEYKKSADKEEEA